MDILFQTKQLHKEYNNMSLLQRRHGERRARLIRRRLDELHAADTLADIGHLPPARCHELTNNRKGQFSVDLDHPYRLLFIPAHDPIPMKADGGIDREQVVAIEIIGVVLEQELLIVRRRLGAHQHAPALHQLRRCQPLEFSDLPARLVVR